MREGAGGKAGTKGVRSKKERGKREKWRGIGDMGKRGRGKERE